MYAGMQEKDAGSNNDIRVQMQIEIDLEKTFLSNLPCENRLKGASEK